MNELLKSKKKTKKNKPNLGRGFFCVQQRSLFPHDCTRGSSAAPSGGQKKILFPKSQAATETVRLQWSFRPSSRLSTLKTDSTTYFLWRTCSLEDARGAVCFEPVMDLNPRKTLNDEVQAESERLKCPTDKLQNWNCWLFLQKFLRPPQPAFCGWENFFFLSFFFF